MTDNRTTKLKAIMDEFEHECFMLRVEASETRARDDVIRKSYERIRDGFAGRIAATLGRPKVKSHPYGYERDTGAYDCTRCECGCINDISATYCNDCGGEIEVDDSAEKEYYDGYSKHTVFAKKHDDGSLEFCERRYIPEDAATLGSEPPYDEALRRIAALEELVWFMVPFFDSACSHECGCPDDYYFDPYGCDDGCKALKELNERMKELGIEVD